MKTLLVLLALLIKVSLYSQSTFINQRFKNEEYRLFLPGPNTEVTNIGVSLSRTDQIYKVDLIEDKDIYIIQNNALKFICDLNSGTTEVFFNGELEGKYATRFWDCFNFYVIDIPKFRVSYHFFRIYSPDKTW